MIYKKYYSKHGMKIQGIYNSFQRAYIIAKLSKKKYGRYRYFIQRDYGGNYVLYSKK